MAIELTTATAVQLSGIGTSLGIAPTFHQLLFPLGVFPFDGNGNVNIYNITSNGTVDFKFFSKYESFNFLFSKGINKILNANVLTNLKNNGTAVALGLSANSLSKSEIDNLFTDLPITTKTATIDVSNNPGAATCDPTIATNKGYTVITS